MTREPAELAFVLHTHLPYVRHHGSWPVGEEWLFQAWAESWLPVTGMLLRLAEDGHRDVLTLGVTPTAAHQLADARLRRELGAWLTTAMWQADEQRTRYEGHDRDAIRALGPFHWRRYAELLRLHEEVEAAGGLLTVWSQLAAAGVVELLAGPATHPYLPLVEDPALVDAQLECGIESQRGWAGRRAAGLWLPECGYRPAGPVADPTQEPVEFRPGVGHGVGHGVGPGTGPDVGPGAGPGVGPGAPLMLPRPGPELPGIEEHLAKQDVTHVVVDAATVVRAAGGERDWTRRPQVPDQPGSDAYDVVYDGTLIGDSDVVAFARDLSVAYHVWSPQAGYPGDPWYRDFHERGHWGGHPSWRVTDKTSDAKAPYEPDRARGRVASHVEHFHGVLRDVGDPRPGALVLAAFDTELFGHWWMEGPDWLEGVLRRVLDDPALRTTTLGSRLERRPPARRLDLPESSWGYAKGHASWVSPETRWMWSELRRVMIRFRALLAGGAPDGAGETGPDGADGTNGAHGADAPGGVLRQLARELALAQASDWPYMVNRGECAGYARDRFAGHVARFDELVELLGGTRDVAGRVEELRRLDDAPQDPSAFLRQRR